MDIQWQIGDKQPVEKVSAKEAVNNIEFFEMMCADCKEHIFIERLEDKGDHLVIFLAPHAC